MINTILIQGIGAIAFCAILFSYFKKEKQQILFMQIIAYIFFTIHYFLLNGITGAICNLIGLFALTTIYVLDKYKLKNKAIASMFFIGLLLVVNLLTFQNLYSIFPLIASTIVIISFLKNDENFIRAIGIISAVCWLTYAIVYKSYISIIFETIALIGVCISLFKNISYKRGNKK